MIKNIIIALIVLLVAGACNEVSNKLITDSKTGKPMLIGETERSSFKTPDFADWYNTEYAAYEPDEFIIAEIIKNISDVNIQIFMGTWCGDSHREVPRFLKIFDKTGLKESRLQIINIDRNKVSPEKHEQGKQIERVPTFILLNGESELGRIIEFPIITLENDLLNILLGIQN